MIEQDIVAGFTAYAPLHSIINDRLTPRVPKGIPQRSAFPCMTYQIVSTVPTYANSGRMATCSTRVQFGIYGRTLAETLATQAAFIAACDLAVQGLLTGFKWPAVIDSLRDLGDPETQIVFPAIDVSFTHQALT